MADITEEAYAEARAIYGQIRVQDYDYEGDIAVIARALMAKNARIRELEDDQTFRINREDSLSNTIVSLVKERDDLKGRVKSLTDGGNEALAAIVDAHNTMPNGKHSAAVLGHHIGHVMVAAIRRANKIWEEA